MCHLQMHSFKFDKNQNKQTINAKKIEAHQVEIETFEAVKEALAFNTVLAEEVEIMKELEIKSIEQKQARLTDSLRNLKIKERFHEDKFAEGLNKILEKQKKI